MFKGFAKQKREIVFASITLLISVILIMIAILSLRFLVVGLNRAVEDPKVDPNQILKFDLEGFMKLGIKQ